MTEVRQRAHTCKDNGRNWTSPAATKRAVGGERHHQNTASKANGSSLQVVDKTPETCLKKVVKHRAVRVCSPNPLSANHLLGSHPVSRSTSIASTQCSSGHRSAPLGCFFCRVSPHSDADHRRPAPESLQLDAFTYCILNNSSCAQGMTFSFAFSFSFLELG